MTVSTQLESIDVRSRNDKLDLDTARYGFLVLSCGGVGERGRLAYQERYDADGEPFPMVSVRLDTDPRTFQEGSAPADLSLLLQMTGSKIEAMRGSPSLFGRHTPELLENLAPFLRSSDIGNGSRTTRVLTQMIWNFHEREIVDIYRQGINLLVSKGGVTRIIPTLKSSTGGGAGSALVPLLLRAQTERRFRTRVLLGYSDDLLDVPVVFFVDPLSYARSAREGHESKILSNAFASRLETDWLIQTRRAASYAFYLGYSNSSGTVLADPTLMGHVLGSGVYAIHRNWADFKARWVDTVDSNALFLRYLGEDGYNRGSQ